MTLVEVHTCVHISYLELLTLNHGLLCTLFILCDGILLIEQANQRDLTCSRFQGAEAPEFPREAY